MCSEVLSTMPLSDARVYTDLAGLQKIKQQARSDGMAALEEVAQQFESIFLKMVLKSMRDANEAFAEDSFFNTQQSKLYRDMYDQQISLSLTQGAGLGLADMLVKQLGHFVQPQDKPTQASNPGEAGQAAQQARLYSEVAAQ